MEHRDTIEFAGFSPNGRLIATASFDRTARLWDAATGKPVSEPLPHDLPVWHAAFSPDGRRLATSDGDGLARVWDAATGEAVTPWLRHERQVVHTVFSPDGNGLLTVQNDGAARIWPVNADSRSVAVLDTLSQFEAGARIDDAGGVVMLKPRALLDLGSKLRPTPR
jgi:WD40 repeat protein